MPKYRSVIFDGLDNKGVEVLQWPTHSPKTMCIFIPEASDGTLKGTLRISMNDRPTRGQSLY